MDSNLEFLPSKDSNLIQNFEKSSKFSHFGALWKLPVVTICS
jgi:hypothetical protein